VLFAVAGVAQPYNVKHMVGSIAVMVMPYGRSVRLTAALTCGGAGELPGADGLL